MPAAAPSAGTGCFLITNTPFAMTDNISQTLEERGKRYGEFIGHAEVTMDLKRAIYRHQALRKQILQDDQQEALDMICHKIGRILNGDPNYADSWRDIAGYALLVADRLMKEQTQP